METTKNSQIDMKPSLLKDVQFSLQKNPSFVQVFETKKMRAKMMRLL